MRIRVECLSRREESYLAIDMNSGGVMKYAQISEKNLKFEEFLSSFGEEELEEEFTANKIANSNFTEEEKAELSERLGIAYPYSIEAQLIKDEQDPSWG